MINAWPLHVVFLYEINLIDAYVEVVDSTLTYTHRLYVAIVLMWFSNECMYTKK